MPKIYVREDTTLCHKIDTKPECIQNLHYIVDENVETD